ncbi:MAG: hypothetical protein DBP02_02080 [gamma proteobacterium symbiont of Ctena orbiculata]|nr:MAG: hypothetical protein DBP02_02080 [gamma proteobacterium symbiont of Ctena orbiculata]
MSKSELKRKNVLQGKPMMEGIDEGSASAVDALVIFCPDCKGEGEVYRGQSHPDDEGYEDCRLCNGKGKFNPFERIRELLIQCDAAEGHYYSVLGKAQEAGIET